MENVLNPVDPAGKLETENVILVLKKLIVLGNHQMFQHVMSKIVPYGLHGVHLEIVQRAVVLGENQEIENVNLALQKLIVLEMSQILPVVIRKIALFGHHGEILPNVLLVVDPGKNQESENVNSEWSVDTVKEIQPISHRVI